MSIPQGPALPSASRRTRSMYSFSSPAPTAISGGCAISTPVPRGRRNAGSRAAGTWHCCVSTRVSGGDRRAWPRVVRSGCSSGRQVCSAARAMCRFSRSMLGDRVPDGMGILSRPLRSKAQPGPQPRFRGTIGKGRRSASSTPGIVSVPRRSAFGSCRRPPIPSSPSWRSCCPALQQC